MRKGFFDWWLGRPKPVRYGISFFLIGLSTLFYFLGQIWFWGWASGGALLFINFIDNDDPV